MSTSGPVRKAAFSAVLILVVLFAGISMASAAPNALTISGHVLLADNSVCAYDSTFLGGQTFRTIDLLDAGGVSLAHDTLSDTGFYSLPLSPTGASLRAICDGTTVNHPLSTAELNAGIANLTLPNRRPVVTSFVATLNGQQVRLVPPGATVHISAQASDPDGDAVQYHLAAPDGIVVPTVDPQQVQWTLPNSPGLHFMYLLVFDFKGGYQQQQLTISTDRPRTWFSIISRDAAWTSPPVVPPPAPVVEPSDHTPAVAHFLTFYARDIPAELDTAGSACAYYHDIGALSDVAVASGCSQLDSHPEWVLAPYQSFTQWKQHWGFGPGSGEASAAYANLADLNLQRDMHTITRPAPSGVGRDVASYVCNYPNPDGDTFLTNILLKRNLVACVAFEYSVTNNPATGTPWNSGNPFTKFITFGPAGNLLLSVNLDGRGEKYLPGACSACHATGAAFQYTTDPSGLGAQFIPYDLDNYHFSTQAPYRRQDQEASFYALNQDVLATNPNAAISELINGWYATSTTFNGSYVPPGWAGQDTLYTAVVKPNCRMCHLSDSSPSIRFNSYADFTGTAPGYAMARTVAAYVCGYQGTPQRLYTMPNAKQTFDRFWNTIASAPPANQVGVLQTWLRTLLADPSLNCQLPSWLP